jgi:hypothetical protein
MFLKIVKKILSEKYFLIQGGAANRNRTMCIYFWLVDEWKPQVLIMYFTFNNIERVRYFLQRDNLKEKASKESSRFVGLKLKKAFLSFKALPEYSDK